MSNFIIWSLSITAIALLIIIVHQKIKKSQGLGEATENITKDKPVIIKQSTDDNKNAQQFQADINSFKSVDNQNSYEEEHKKDKIADGSEIDKYYLPLLKRLALSQQETKEFSAFLQERRTVWNRLSDELNNSSKMDDEKKDLIKKLEDSAWEYDNRARKLLGYKRYQQYSEFHNYMGIFRRDPIEEIDSQLDVNDALNKVQEEQLITAMAEAFDNFMSFAVPEVKGPPGFRIKLKDRDVGNKMREDLDSLRENYMFCAKSILTENQRKVYTDFIDYQIRIRKMFYKVGRK